ncbi:MAG: hypothetical protein KF724_02020 [Phycisphaeraceae bacterium]|nr:hypothetical protein [Phycisphaeraceae bacterium]
MTPGAGAPSPDEISELPPLPETPGAITEIVAARPFVVTDAWESDWARERPEVSQGWVVVLRAPHAFVFPRQTQEPILLAGARAVERVANVPSANLILAIVPATPRSAAVPGFAAGEGASSPNGDQASVNRPLSELAFWFGTPGLPEQLDLAGIAHEIVLAEQVSIGPRSSDEVARALDRGGEALMIKDREALLRAVEPWARRLGITFPEDVGDEGGANNASGPAGSAPSGR